MLIHLEGIGKRFYREWIFRNVTLQLESNHKYAIVGHNGSGKSTLLQLIAGVSLPTEGRLTYQKQEGKPFNVANETDFSFAAPYQELPEELTGEELLAFHYKFRKKAVAFDSNSFFDQIGIGKQGDKQIKFYSSGMKQRMRLGLCLFTEAEAYFLDEPTTNLDKSGAAWYRQLLAERMKDKLLVISSNIEEEYGLCDKVVAITDFKTKK